MPELVKIGNKADLPPPGEAREFEANGRTICVANVAGVCSALDNVCAHRGGPLGQGVIEDGKLVCPWHGWAFDPVTGEAGHSPLAKVAVHDLKIEGEDVLVEL